jgi:hypothetical protein
MLTHLLCLFAEASCGAAEVEYVGRLWSPPQSFPPTLADVASRLPPSTDARDPDLVTYTHEGNHFLSRGKEGYHGVYIGSGIRVFITTPPVMTAEVFAAVPAEERGSIFDTYRRQGEHQYWATQPLMVVDEWLAYTAGSLARRELALPNRQESDRHCATMATYVWHLHRLASAKPEYPIKELTDFCRWNEERCRVFIPDWGKMFTKKFD